MNILSRRTHGILDYAVGMLLLLAPRLLGLDPASAEARVPFFLGCATLVYSLLTRYELGLIKVLPFGAHLTLDFFNGALLAVSPWVFGFAERVWLPHLLLGLFELAAVFMTRNSAAVAGHVAGTPARH